MVLLLVLLSEGCVVGKKLCIFEIVCEVWLYVSEFDDECVMKDYCMKLNWSVWFFGLRKLNLSEMVDVWSGGCEVEYEIVCEWRLSGIEVCVLDVDLMYVWVWLLKMMEVRNEDVVERRWYGLFDVLNLF